jgi:hypothetical protein
MKLSVAALIQSSKIAAFKVLREEKFSGNAV